MFAEGGSAANGAGLEKPGEPGSRRRGSWWSNFTQFYAGDQAQLDGGADESSNPAPREVLVPCLPDNAEELVTWLSALRGSKVALRVPQRGDKRVLAETVQRNARSPAAAQAETGGDFTARSAALAEHSGNRSVLPMRRCESNVSTSPRPGHRRGGVPGGVRGRIAPGSPGLGTSAPVRPPARAALTMSHRSRRTRRRFLRHLHEAEHQQLTEEPSHAGSRIRPPGMLSTVAHPR